MKILAINQRSSRKKTLENDENYFKWRLTRANKIALLAQKHTSFYGKRTLDFGCGQGPLSYLLYQKGARVYAVDVSDQALKKMRKFIKSMRIDIMKVNSEKLPYKDNFFDLIFSFDFIEHVKDYEKYFGEMNRCLKNRDYIFLEMTPFYAIISGHHLYDFTLLPAQYLPEKVMKWWVLKKK